MITIWVECIHHTQESCLKIPCWQLQFKKYEKLDPCYRMRVWWTTFIIQRKHFKFIEEYHD